jgi:hypothetical protein
MKLNKHEIKNKNKKNSLKKLSDHLKNGNRPSMWGWGKMVAEEILSEIDATLEQLIRNAETLKVADLSDLSEAEIDAFKKTQESLLHHLLNLDRDFETKRKSLPIQNTKSASFKIQEKHKRFEKLKDDVNNTIRKAEKKCPLFSKRHGKRLFF